MRNPVAIMFHSVGLDRLAWSYRSISEPLRIFEAKMAALARAGYPSTFFKSMDGAPSVALTFDDGYLDNWVHVLPTLRKHGLKATFFVTPEFVDPRDVLRSQVEPGAAPDGDHDARDCCAGFMSWAELRAAEASGLVDVQSHALTHTWHFSGPRIVDFWRPGSATEPDGPVWMLWNASPSTKPFYLTRAAAEEERIPYGSPVFERGKSLVARRFFPDPALEDRLARYVGERGGPAFFEEPGWRDRLHEVAAEFRAGAAVPPGRSETEGEYEARVRRELWESKAAIEERLEKTVEALCCPGGGISERVMRLAREAGYRAFICPHVPPLSGDAVSRMGNRWRLRWRGRELGVITAREFLWHIEAFGGSSLHRWLIRFALLLRAGRAYALGR